MQSSFLGTVDSEKSLSLIPGEDEKSELCPKFLAESCNGGRQGGLEWDEETGLLRNTAIGECI